MLIIKNLFVGLFAFLLTFTTSISSPVPVPVPEPEPEPFLNKHLAMESNTSPFVIPLGHAADKPVGSIGKFAHFKRRGGIATKLGLAAGKGIAKEVGEQGANAAFNAIANKDEHH